MEVMDVIIDEKAGYCFGVEFAIQMAEAEIAESGKLYCLGDIVHNRMEIERLKNKGLITIDRKTLKTLKNCKVLIRAHGEPPETYRIALENNIEIIDASCPVVLKLQNRIKRSFDELKPRNGQMLIYGKEGHAEVVGLTGQTNNEALVISTIDDLAQVDFARPISLYSQTTKSTKGFYEIKAKIQEKILEKGINPEETFKANDSICRQVSNRMPQMERFSQKCDVVVFVSGKKSSNGKALYNVCKSFNPKSYFVEEVAEVQPEWFENAEVVGISGATSTPVWLMREVAAFIKNIKNQTVNT